MTLRDELDRIARETLATLEDVAQVIEVESPDCVLTKILMPQGPIRSALDRAVEECVKVLEKDTPPLTVTAIERLRAALDKEPR